MSRKRYKKHVKRKPPSRVNEEHQQGGGDHGTRQAAGDDNPSKMSPRDVNVRRDVIIGGLEGVGSVALFGLACAFTEARFHLWACILYSLSAASGLALFALVLRRFKYRKIGVLCFSAIPVSLFLGIYTGRKANQEDAIAEKRDTGAQQTPVIQPATQDEPLITIDVGDSIDQKELLDTRFVLTNRSLHSISKVGVNAETWNPQSRAIEVLGETGVDYIPELPTNGRFTLNPIEAMGSLMAGEMANGGEYPALAIIQFKISFLYLGAPKNMSFRFQGERRADGTYAWFPMDPAVDVLKTKLW